MKSKNFKDVSLTLVGLFVTIFLTPLVATGITWYIFPNIQMTFIQVMWIYFCIWMGIQYITISIEKSIERK